MTDRRPLLHIARKQRWEAAADLYRDPSLDCEGFIHLSLPDQVLIPANERFAGQNDLVLLVIDPTKLRSEVVFEDCYETGMCFPHLYGPLPTAAVAEVLPLVPGPDGRFELPAAVPAELPGN